MHKRTNSIDKKVSFGNIQYSAKIKQVESNKHISYPQSSEQFDPDEQQSHNPTSDNKKT
jgi:hypothetical protein